MKYAIALVVGIVFGVLAFFVGFYNNPFVGRAELSPLAVSESGLNNLSYSAVSAKSIIFTNDGESISAPHPGKVAELWEPTVNKSELIVTSLIDSRGILAGIGVKMSTPSETTRLIDSKVIVDSVWHVYLPGRGTLAVYQQENWFAYLRDIVVPARRSSSDSWRGTWSRNMTVGPGALGTAVVSGMGGSFDGMQSEAVESLNARAYSSLQGPVQMTGTLSVIIPTESEQVAESPDQ